VVKFVGGALSLPGRDIYEFLGGYDSNWGALSPPSPPLKTPMTVSLLGVPLNYLTQEPYMHSKPSASA